MYTRIAVIAAVLVGTASVAFANEPVRREHLSPRRSSTTRSAPMRSRRPAMGQRQRGARRAARSEEKQMFERAQGAAD